LLVAGFAALVLGAAGAAAPPVQTNWLILSANGTTDYIAKETLTGEPGPGDDWTFDAKIRVTWKQTAKNATLPGSRVVSFNFKTMPPYVRGQSGQQQNPIHDIAATITGNASSTDYTSSESCTPAGTVEKGFYEGSAVNDLFLASARDGTSLVPFVRGQSPTFAISRTQCPKLKIPLVLDVKREQIRRTGLTKLYSIKPCAKTSLTVFRTVPVVEKEQTVGQVTERAKITLQVPKYVKGRLARCK
jgi:hypothetical protein